MNHELKLNHLSVYLPHQLEMQYIVRDKVQKVGILKNLYFNSCETHPERASIDNDDLEHIWMFKPILRPMTDLFEQIEHLGEVIVPADVIGKYFEQYEWSKSEHLELNILEQSLYDRFIIGDDKQLSPFCPILVSNILCRLHFDIYGLIPKGLATIKNIK